MKPLIVLVSTFVLTILCFKLIKGHYELALAARISMSIMLVFTAVAHFVYTKGMTMMLPPFVPYKTIVVYLTGLIEVTAAVGLLIPKLQTVTAWLLIAFFLLILPANVYASLKTVDYQNANLEGNGLVYLWFRIPLQVVFIAWIYLSCLKG